MWVLSYSIINIGESLQLEHKWIKIPFKCKLYICMLIKGSCANTEYTEICILIIGYAELPINCTRSNVCWRKWKFRQQLAAYICIYCNCHPVVDFGTPDELHFLRFYLNQPVNSESILCKRNNLGVHKLKVRLEVSIWIQKDF